ncbi:MAG TPA: HAD family hydrolase [Anaerolineae bacterium]|nr:HAD family hydrolase [Anaerolineae bacterium]HMR64790.1 HAD family hydrolase [Anaerolineae bacterium]
MSITSIFDQRRLLVADIDDVLLNEDSAGREKLQAALEKERESLTLVYVSGQNLARQIEAIDTYQLLMPDYIISLVGTEIHRLPGENPVDEWYHYVYEGFRRSDLVTFMADRYAELTLQEEDHQSPLKVSYYWRDATPAQLDQLQQDLLEAHFSIKLVYSRRIYLDIIPERAGIGPAVKFLVDSLLLAPSQVFVCGGTENDADLFQYGFRGIVVGNATYALKRAVELRAYFSHSNYALGLLEGLRHYKFFNEIKPTRTSLVQEGLNRAVESLRHNLTPLGFSAAGLGDNPLTTEDSNYFAVWSRDGIKTGLWSLRLNDPDITECFKRTLEILAETQSPAGQIPANVQIKTGKPDYGGVGDIASIDSVLWFVIGGSRFAAYTGDRDFLTRIYPHLGRAMHWLNAHDSNNCGLIEVPESSDWMDLFPRSYNVLYDEVLWYLACRDFSVVQAAMGDDGQGYSTLAETVRRKIQRQFWPTAQKLSEARESFSETQFTLGNAQYLLDAISPFGFSWRCDVYANLLAGLMGLLSERQMEQIFQFLWGVGVNSPYPVKCYYPPVTSGAADWKDYFVTNFLNLPDHYHNGGIWPFIGGLWVRFLARIGRVELAHQELNALAEACRLGLYEAWEFNEWLHGQTGRPMGKAHQAWSSAGYIAAYQALYNDTVPADFIPLTVDMFQSTRDQS